MRENNIIDAKRLMIGKLLNFLMFVAVMFLFSYKERKSCV